MMKNSQRRCFVLITAILLIAAPAVVLRSGPRQGQSLPAQQQAGEKKALTIDDYGRWRSIASAAISDDGQWACYIYRPREGDSNLYVKQLDGEHIRRMAQFLKCENKRRRMHFSPPPEPNRLELCQLRPSNPLQQAQDIQV